MRILICSNGSAWANRALETGKEIALAVGGEVDILAVTRRASLPDALEKAVRSVADILRAGNVTATVHRREGHLAQEVTRQTAAERYDLVVIGSRGRRGIKRTLLGSLAAHVTEHAQASVLVVKGKRRPLKHFMICSAAGPASEYTVRFAGRLAKAMGAAVTVVHVMSQLSVGTPSNAADLEAPAQELMTRSSREGVHLDRMLDLLAEEGVEAQAVVRHGLVVEEIIAEAREGRCCDLLVLGSHTTPGVNPWLVDNLSVQALLAANLPVLVVGGTEHT